MNYVTYNDYTGIRHDDLSKIINYNLLKIEEIAYIDEECNAIETYLMRLFYKDGTYKDMRVMCEYGTRRSLDKNLRKAFFFDRLFGNNGLIVKEKRNDYIYLGGISKRNGKFDRFNTNSKGITMQRLVDIYLSNDIFPYISYTDEDKKYDFDFDLFNYVYYFHSGNEDWNIVFKKGLRSRFGIGFGNGTGKSFASLGSTFYPASGCYNNLCNATKIYSRNTRNPLGGHCLILRVPRSYCCYLPDKEEQYPMPTHRLTGIERGDAYIIPELIYGVYDSYNNEFHKNPNYNPLYDPSGLVYDVETARNFEFVSPQWYQFMQSRAEIPYYKLKRMDIFNPVIAQLRQHYGISRKLDLPNILNNFGRKR